MIEPTKTPEAKCLLDFTKKRLHKKLGCNLIFTGEVGHGKSSASIRFLELHYKKWFDEEFPVKHICQKIEEAILLIKDFKRKGEGVLVEELSPQIGVRDTMTRVNKLWNNFLDLCRHKQVVLVGNCPHLGFIDKHHILMCHVWVDILGVNFRKKITIGKPLWLQPSPYKKEPYYHKFVNEKGFPIDLLFFRKPLEELWKVYEEMKEIGNKEYYEEIAMKLSHERINQLREIGQKVLPERELEAYILWLQGYKSREAYKKMELKNLTTYCEYLKRAKNKLKQPEFQRFAKEIEQKHSKRVIKTTIN